MTLSQIITVLEAWAPPAYQESYDDCGLQVGRTDAEITGALVALDVTENVVEEAAERGCNLIIAHHPLLFKGIKRLSATGSETERILWQAVKHDISIYAIHTNLDNMVHGVNAMFAEKIGLNNTRILAPQEGTLLKLQTYVPATAAAQVREALFAAGGGAIGAYRECSFESAGKGSFRPLESANPAIGTAGGPREIVEEVKLEVLVPRHLQQPVLLALRKAHPYEEVAYELIPLVNTNEHQGAGMVGELTRALSPGDFLALLKEKLGTPCIRHTAPVSVREGSSEKAIQKVAICGGAGSFLLSNAIRAGADAFVTGDFKYHEFFGADGRLLIADVGHWESEQYTTDLIITQLRQKLPNFAAHPAKSQTNPVHYYF